MRHAYARLLDAMAAGGPLALATLIETRGSAPQTPGATAVFGAGGLLDGTLGGGLLEADATGRAIDALRTGESILYEFLMMSDISDPAGAICGGRAAILVDADPARHAGVFEQVRESLEGQRGGVLLTRIDRAEGAGITIERDWLEDRGTEAVEIPEAYHAHADRIARVSRSRASRLIVPEQPGAADPAVRTLLFAEAVRPHPQLVICGAGHIGRALAHLGTRLDFEVTVVDERPEYANAARVPDADHILVGPVGPAFESIPITPDTYVVLVNPGHRGDTDALRRCIGKSAAYIGMIGSRRKTELVRKTFLREGWATEEQFDRVHAPIGLGIGAVTVEEIAVSIAAELIAVRRATAEQGAA